MGCGGRTGVVIRRAWMRGFARPGRRHGGLGGMGGSGGGSDCETAIFTSKCVFCHSTAGPSAGLDLAGGEPGVCRMVGKPTGAGTACPGGTLLVAGSTPGHGGVHRQDHQQPANLRRIVDAAGRPLTDAELTCLTSWAARRDAMTRKRMQLSILEPGLLLAGASLGADPALDRDRLAAGRAAGRERFEPSRERRALAQGGRWSWPPRRKRRKKKAAGSSGAASGAHRHAASSDTEASPAGGASDADVQKAARVNPTPSAPDTSSADGSAAKSKRRRQRRRGRGPPARAGPAGPPAPLPRSVGRRAGLLAQPDLPPADHDDAARVSAASAGRRGRVGGLLPGGAFHRRLRDQHRPRPEPLAGVRDPVAHARRHHLPDADPRLQRRPARARAARVDRALPDAGLRRSRLQDDRRRTARR